MPELQSSRFAQTCAPPRWAVRRSSLCTGDGPKSSGCRAKSWTDTSPPGGRGDPESAACPAAGLRLSEPLPLLAGQRAVLARHDAEVAVTLHVDGLDAVDVLDALLAQLGAQVVLGDELA